MGSSKKEASEKFEEAIKEYLAAKGEDDALLIDWFLISAQHMVDDEGSSTILGIHAPLDQALYRGAGLVKYANSAVRRMFDDDGGE